MPGGLAPQPEWVAGACAGCVSPRWSGARSPHGPGACTGGRNCPMLGCVPDATLDLPPALGWGYVCPSSCPVLSQAFGWCSPPVCLVRSWCEAALSLRPWAGGKQSCRATRRTTGNFGGSVYFTGGLAPPEWVGPAPVNVCPGGLAPSSGAGPAPGPNRTFCFRWSGAVLRGGACTGT